MPESASKKSEHITDCATRQPDKNPPCGKLRLLVAVAIIVGLEMLVIPIRKVFSVCLRAIKQHGITMVNHNYRKKEVCGQFPQFCYRVYGNKDLAEQFINGIFRLNCLYNCRNMECDSRRDPTEGEGCTLEPGIVTNFWVSSNPADKTIWTREKGYKKHVIQSGNATFCFCTCLPDVDPDHMKKSFGGYIVRIDNPKKLAEDINDYFTNKGQKFLIEGCKVIYNKGKKLDKELSNNERLDMPYKQKPEKFSPDCEFRIVAIRFGISCNLECKFLDGQLDMDCKYTTVNLDKKLDYLSFVRD